MIDWIIYDFCLLRSFLILSTLSILLLFQYFGNPIFNILLQFCHYLTTEIVSHGYLPALDIHSRF